MNDIFAIVGPTASGKSGVGQNLVMNYNFSVINFDSCQLYCELDILKALPESYFEHYLYKIFQHDHNVSVVDWCNLAVEKIDEIKKRLRAPILIGGTAFYIKSLVEGVTNLPAIPLDITNYVESLSYEVVVQKLSLLDLESLLHYKDLRRLKRSLCVVLATNLPIKHYFSQKRKTFEVENIKILALLPSKKQIIENIKFRLNRDFEEMVQEVASLKNGNLYDLIIGVREIRMYLDSLIDQKNCIDLIFYRTYQYAKRQNTFIRNSLNVFKKFDNKNDLESFIINHAF